MMSCLSLHRESKYLVPEDKMKEVEMVDKKSRKGYVYHDTVRKRRNF